MALETLIVKMLGDGGSASKMLSTINREITQVGATATRIGKSLTIGLTAPIIAAGAGAVKAAGDMNRAMANIATLGVGGDRLTNIKTEIQDIAILVAKSTDDIAGGMFQVISAFGDSADAVDILRINAKAATAGLSTTEEAIRLTSAVSKGYGDTSAAAIQRVADLAFVTNKLGQTTFPELAKSIGKVVPLMKTMGGTQEELFAVMATATGVTGNAAEVSTQLRGILQSILAPTESAADAIKAAGFESGEAMVKQLGLMKSIETMTKAANKTGQPLQKFISSIEGQTLALALTGAQATNYQDKLAAMQDVLGATDAAFAAQTQGISKTGFTWKQTAIRVQVLAQRIGDALLPIINRLISRVTPLVASLAQWINANQGLTAGLLIVGAVIGPVLIVVGQLTSILATIIPIVTAVAGAILAFINPIVLAIAVVAGLIAVTRWLAGSWEEVGLIFKEVGILIADALVFALRVQRRLWNAFFGWLIARVREVFTMDFVQAVMAGLKKAGELLVRFGEFALAKLRAVFTGSETGTFEDFMGEISKDFQAGGSQRDFLKTASNIVGEELALFRKSREGRQIITPELRSRIGEKIQPVQAALSTGKDEASKAMEGVKTDTAEMVELLRASLNKETVELSPLALSR